MLASTVGVGRFAWSAAVIAARVSGVRHRPALLVLGRGSLLVSRSCVDRLVRWLAAAGQ